MNERVVSDKEQNLLAVASEANYVKMVACRVLSVASDLKKVEDLTKKYGHLLEEVQKMAEARLEDCVREMRKTYNRLGVE